MLNLPLLFVSTAKRRLLLCSTTRPTSPQSTWRVHLTGLLPVLGRAAPRSLVVATRWASTVRCIAVQMQRTSTIPVCMPIASPATINGKQQHLGRHLGRDDDQNIMRMTCSKYIRMLVASVVHSNYILRAAVLLASYIYADIYLYSMILIRFS